MSNCSAEKVPSEVLDLISEYLPKSAVASFAATNAHFYFNFCPILYRCVYNGLSTLALPKTARSLPSWFPHPTSFVVEWHLNSQCNRPIIGNIPRMIAKRRSCVAIAQSLENIRRNGGSLRKLRYSSTVPVHEAFRKTCLRQFRLESLDIHSDICTEPAPDGMLLLNVYGAQLRELKLTFTRELMVPDYDDWGGVAHVPDEVVSKYVKEVSAFIQKIHRTCPNLTSLTLEIDCNRESVIIDAIRALKLPNLYSLSIQFFSMTQMYNEAALDLGPLLENSPNLKYLSSDGVELFVPPFLRSCLTSFTGHFRDLMQIYPSLPMISTLIIDLFEVQNWPSAVTNVIGEKLIEALSAFSCLKDLDIRLHVPQCVSSEGLQQIVQACPHLERLKCTALFKNDIFKFISGPGGKPTRLKWLKLFIFQPYSPEDYYQLFVMWHEELSYVTGGHYNPEEENRLDLVDPAGMQLIRLEKYAEQISDCLASSLPLLRTVELGVDGFDHCDEDSYRHESCPDFFDWFIYDVQMPQTDGRRAVIGKCTSDGWKRKDPVQQV